MADPSKPVNASSWVHNELSQIRSKAIIRIKKQDHLWLDCCAINTLTRNCYYIWRNRWHTGSRSINNWGIGCGSSCHPQLTLVSKLESTLVPTVLPESYRQWQPVVVQYRWLSLQRCLSILSIFPWDITDRCRICSKSHQTDQTSNSCGRVKGIEHLVQEW